MARTTCVVCYACGYEHDVEHVTTLIVVRDVDTREVSTIAEAEAPRVISVDGCKACDGEADKEDKEDSDARVK